MPMWVSEDGEEMVAIGSIAELKELSGVEVSRRYCQFMMPVRFFLFEYRNGGTLN